MNLAKYSMVALLAGGLMLFAVPSRAQQYKNQNSQSSPAEAGNVTPGTAVSPGPGVSYRDAIAGRAQLGFNAPAGTYQQTLPDAPQYQGIQPGSAGYSTSQPGAAGYSTEQSGSTGYSTSQPGTTVYSTDQSGATLAPYGSTIIVTPSAPAPYGATAPAPSGTIIVTPSAPAPPSAMAPAPSGAAEPASPQSFLQSDYQRARQALNAGAYREAAQWLNSSASLMDQLIATNRYAIDSQAGVVAARNNLNALAGQVARGEIDSVATLDRAFSGASQAVSRFQADQARAASQAGSGPMSTVPPGASIPPSGSNY